MKISAMTDFSHDSTSLFDGHIAEDQIEAYKYCLDGIARLEQDLAKCIGA